MPANNPIIVTGTPKPNSWSQAYAYSFGSTQILLLISLRQTGILDLSMYGNKLAEDIYHQLTQQLPSDLASLKKTIQPFISQAKNLDLDLYVSLIKNNHLTSLAYGQLQLQLIRHQRQFTLLSQPPKLTGLTGQLQPNDIIFSSTTKLYQLLAPNLITLLKDSDLSETLNRLIHAQTDSSQLTGLIYRHSTDKPPFSFKLPRPKLFFFKPKLKLKLRQPPSKKNQIFALVLLLFFSLSLTVGFLKRKQLVQKQQYQQLTQTINHNLNLINQLASTQPDQALQLFHQSQSLLQTYLNQHQNSPFIPQANNLNQKLQSLQTQLFHFLPTNPQVYLDLTSLTQTNQLPYIALDSQNHLLNLNFSNQQDFVLNLQDKSTLQLKLPLQPLDSRLWHQQLFLLTPQGVNQLSLDSQKISSIIQADDNWQSPSFLDLYAGNIYVLDKSLGEIWKYPVLNQGYGHRKRWLAPGITADFSKVIGFRIDGQVWLLTSSGKLQSFLKGAPTSFKLNGFVSHLTNPKDFYLTETEIFVLEPNQARILVFSKETGQYLRQYQSDQFKSAQQIFVDQNWLYFTHDHFLSRFPLK